MRVRLALIPLALAATLLAGCATKDPASTATPTPTPTGNGVAALSAKEIAAKALAAAKDAKSFHVKGTATKDGQTTKIDMSISGSDYAGTIEAQGVALDLVRIGNDVYIKAPDAFWAAQIPANLQSALAGFKGKYVKVDASNAAFASFKDLFTADAILKSPDSVAKGTTKTINGKAAIGIIDTSDQSVLYVATEGVPYPLRIEPSAVSPSTSASPSASATASGASGGMDFTDFGTATVKAPDAATVFDLKTITG